MVPLEAPAADAVMRRPVDNATVRAGLLALLVAGAIYLYLPTIAWLGRQWLGPGPAGGAARDWSHGPLVVLFIGFLLLRRREEFHAGGAPSPRGIPLITAGIGLHLAGYLSEAPYLSAYSIIPLAAGLAYWILGSKVGSWLLPPLLLFVLAVPFPANELGIVGFLQDMVASGSAFLAGLAGVSVYRSGLNISVGEVDYLIEPLCSGFNLIMALLSVVLPVLYLKRASMQSLGAALFWAPVLGLGTKIALVSIILALTPSLGADTALSFYHGWLGVLFFLASLGVALLIARGSGALGAACLWPLACCMNRFSQKYLPSTSVGVQPPRDAK